MCACNTYNSRKPNLKLIITMNFIYDSILGLEKSIMPSETRGRKNEKKVRRRKKHFMCGPIVVVVVVGAAVAANVDNIVKCFQNECV